MTGKQERSGRYREKVAPFPKESGKSGTTFNGATFSRGLGKRGTIFGTANILFPSALQDSPAVYFALPGRQ